MKITIFGASGQTGQYLIKQALELGHEVNAYVRRENAIGLQDPKLKVIIGNLNDENKLREAISGSAVCLSTLGGNSMRKPSTEITEGIQLIIRIMEEEKVKRVIYLSSIGANESRYYMAQPIRFLIVDLMFKVPLADHSKNENAITNSNLNYTIIRPGGLTDGPKKEQINSGTEKIVLKGNPKISRSSVAYFMLKQLSNEKSYNKAIWLYEEK